MPQSSLPSRLRALGLASAAALAVSGCSGRESRVEPGLGLAFDMVEVPGAFDREGMARRPDRDAPGGYWAAVADLPRAETAVVRRLGAGQGDSEVTVALFRAPRQQADDQIVLSEAAAAVLGIGAVPVAVRVTAVRKEPELVLTANRF